MTDYLTEQEQVELLKNWVKQYSLIILMGILIAVMGVTGWRYWQQRQQKTLSHASAIYDEMLTKRAQNDVKATDIQAEKLLAHYSHTVYSQMAALMLARDAVLKKNYPSAEKHLQWVLDHSQVSALTQIARMRLARVYIAEQKPQEAIAMLQTNDDKSFNGLTEEIKGDAYLAMRDLTKAKAAYQKALVELPNAESIRPLLQMKYDNLTTQPSAS